VRAGEEVSVDLEARIAASLPLRIRLDPQAHDRLVQLGSARVFCRVSRSQQESRDSGEEFLLGDLARGEIATVHRLPHLDGVDVRFVLDTHSAGGTSVLATSTSTFDRESMQFRPVEITVDPSWFLTGSVVGSEDEPLRGAEVTIEGVRSTGYVTSVSNRFFLVRDRTTATRIRAKFGSVGTSDWVTVMPGTAPDVTLRVDTTRCVRFSLRRPDGRPVESFAVHSNNESLRPRESAPRFGSSGTFVLRNAGVPAGSRFYFRGDGFAEFREDFANELAPGSTIEVVVREQPQATVVVRVAGKMPPRASIDLVEVESVVATRWRRPWEYSTRPYTGSGAFDSVTFDGVAVGDYTIKVALGATVFASQRVAVGGGVIEVDLSLDAR